MQTSASAWDRVRAALRDRLLLGNEPTPELFAILTNYFVQGILNLARVAVSFFLKDELGLSPAQASALLGIAVLPWAVKPLLGFLSDGVPLFGYRRRPYLFLSGALGAGSWLALATVVDSAWSAAIAFMLGSLSVAISDVIADSIVVDRAREESIEQAGSLQSLCWGTVAIGGALTAYLSGWLLQVVDTRVVFAITATFPLLVAIAASIISEEPARGDEARPHVGAQVRRLWGAFRQRSILLPTLFIFFWQATPSADSALFYFMTEDLHFEPEFFGRLRLVTSLASLFGVWLFQRFLKSVPFRTIFVWSALLSSLLGMTSLLLVTHANRALGIGDRWFSLGDDLILTVIGQVTFMPVLVLAARLCPEGVEATLFASLMSVFNLGRLLSNELGALLTEWLGVTQTQFDNLWVLVLLANLSTLLPLAFLNWVPATDPQAEAKSESPAAIAEEPVGARG